MRDFVGVRRKVYLSVPLGQMYPVVTVRGEVGSECVTAARA
jgi:hypothetical protein